ncbi:MAG: HAMP domain-containing protein, partial [Lachnospiraceae bacterium]|nr:HAMP domain-containing protein [Lachnospiraceae bacterium]
MKFSMKLVLSTMIVLALALGFSGFYFVNYVFETSLEREVGQALDESSILSFAFETAALNVPLKYSVLPDSVVEEIASKLEMGGQGDGRLLRIADEEKNILYTSGGFTSDEGLLTQTDPHTKSYRVIRAQDRFYVHTCAAINALNRILYLETMKDVTEVFTERSLGFSLYRKVTLVMLLTGMVIMLFIASLLTKPIRLLTRATREMAAGDYHYRARQISRDELGQLTGDFNRMANALEEN